MNAQLAAELKTLAQRILTLLGEVERWLQANGCGRLWLTTDIDERLRAHGFYRRHGWRDERIENGIRYMVKDMDAGPTSRGTA